MDRYAVVGNPVEHSRSPAIHALFAAQTGQALQYDKVLAPPDGFGAVLDQLAASGLLGCNVTLPFKAQALAHAAAASERAQRAGAANTLRRDHPGWWADNTDGAGLVRDIERNAGVPLLGQRVLLIGAGGAAAGVLGPLIEARPRELVVSNRSTDKAGALVGRHLAWARRHGVGLQVRELANSGHGYDVVINGSSSSLAGGGVPVGAAVLRAGTLALDMMYGPAAAGWLQWAGAHGAVGRDGLGMLVEQAAEAFSLWRGVVPDTAPVLAALRRQVDLGG